MRRYVKNEIINIINGLSEANETIRANLNTLTQNEILDVLTDCQQKAIATGNKIELEEGNGTTTVSLLEDYCENVYQLSKFIVEVQKAKQLIKIISNLLIKINNSIQYDLPDSKKEIVFLSYITSMWDSLESIWLAARDDLDCDAYVIPIPYFDRNADGTFGLMHYESNDYPDYVPITLWTEYSIPIRHPDVIYFHNPYDGYNKVTSVHPNYYAKELKKHTNMLIYIPYFVCLDDVPEHFCVLPGTMYADRVIVQSEIVRLTYIREFQKFEDENHCKGLFGNSEEKFLALGSPKFDKVFQTKRENVEIPEQWKLLLENSDGTRKKVIFYNTTIDAMLKNNRKMLEKIKDVLNAFRGNSEFVLLWRPHPLIMNTIASLRNDLYVGYQKIVESYKADEWGIYDDSSDLNRAIAISDAYFGDWSSIVALYKKTGKPIMIQNADFLTNI